MVILHKDVIEKFQALESRLAKAEKLGLVTDHFAQMNNVSAKSEVKKLKLDLQRCWEKAKTFKKNASQNSTLYLEWLEQPLAYQLPSSSSPSEEKKAPGRPEKRLSEVGPKARIYKLAPVVPTV